MAIGFFLDSDDTLLQKHMLYGIVALFLLLFRLQMDFVRSRDSRFSGFPLRPREVTDYIKFVRWFRRRNAMSETITAQQWPQ